MHRSSRFVTQRRTDVEKGADGSWGRTRPLGVRGSEGNPDAHLHVAHGASCIEGAEVGVVRPTAKRGQVDMVEEVEHVGADLQTDLLGELKPL